MSCSLATTTWNSIDQVGIFLAHYRKLGVEQLFVTDFDSTDGTRDVLASREWQGFVRLVSFAGLTSDPSNDTLALVQATAGPDDWCLFCDPDELLITPSMNIEEAFATARADGAEALSIPRFNMTAARSTAQSAQERLTALDALDLRIDRRATRNVQFDIAAEVLDPPWIYTAIPGKVLTHTRSAVAVGEGDHTIRTRNDSSKAAPTGVYLLHYPFRSFDAFREKIDKARRTFSREPASAGGVCMAISSVDQHRECRAAARRVRHAIRA